MPFLFGFVLFFHCSPDKHALVNKQPPRARPLWHGTCVSISRGSSAFQQERLQADCPPCSAVFTTASVPPVRSLPQASRATGARAGGKRRAEGHE